MRFLGFNFTIAFMPYSNFIFFFSDTELQCGDTFILNDVRQKKCYMQLCTKRDILTDVQFSLLELSLLAVKQASLFCCLAHRFTFDYV